MENIKIRQDLGKVVCKDIRFALIKTRYNERKAVVLELKPVGNAKQGDVIEFADKEGLYDLYSASKKLGRNVIKSMTLVEEIKKDVDDDSKSVYVAVLIVLEDGSEFRLFPNRTDKMRIDLYYDELKKAESKKASA